MNIKKLFLCIGCLMFVFFIIVFPMAFRNRGIYIDEAWIGQQVHSLINDGSIKTQLFMDYPPLDNLILVYHKLTVWIGGIFTNIFGWGLFQLRMVSLISGIVLLIILFFFTKSFESKQVATLACLILLWSPVFWEQMRIFRPEMLMTCLGLISFFILKIAYLKKNNILIIIAGIFAGLSGLAHPLGLSFMISGMIALSFEKQIKKAIILLSSSLLIFTLYITGIFFNEKLFFEQLFDKSIMSSKISITWLMILSDLLNEHKRIFRGPDSFGITVLFILALFNTAKINFRNNRFFWIYLSSLFILNAAAPFPKIIRYMLPITPFLAIAISKTLNNMLTNIKQPVKITSIFFIIWICVFIIYGGYSLICAAAALHDGNAPNEIEGNRLLAEKMEEKTRVMAPFDFVFGQIDDFTIISWWGCEVSAGDTFTPSYVDKYAYLHGIEYIILNEEHLRKLKIIPEAIGSSFLYYTPIFLSNNINRYLLIRKPNI